MDSTWLESALERVQRRLIVASQARGADLSPWFVANEKKISLLGKLLASIAQAATGQTPEEILTKCRALVEQRLSAQSSWFTQNLPLLRLITKELLSAPRPEANRTSVHEAQVKPPVFEAIPISGKTEPAPDALLGNVDAIMAFLNAEGLNQVDANKLASVTDLEELREELSEQTQMMIRRVNTALAEYASEASRTRLRPDSLVAEISDDRAEAIQPAVNAAVDRAARESVGAVAGFLALLRRKRQAGEACFQNLVARFGQLGRSLSTRTLPDGTLQDLADSTPLDATVLLGMAVSQSLRVVEQTGDLESEPNDLRTAAKRTKANIEAIQILARGGTASADDLEKLRLYSGWGGLSISAVQDRVPPGWLPESRGLIHEYYTPTIVAQAVANAVKPMLATLRDSEGRLRALEPSAGIGRFLHATNGDGFDLKWTAIEYSKVSAQLLQMLRPDVEVFLGPFEEWVQKSGDRVGTFALVLSNPPYGERGRAATIDRDPIYRYRQAYFYQMRRACEFLKEGGLGCFIVPGGFLTGTSSELIDHRREILLSNHLAAAFRLPSQDGSGRSLFPGALLVTDLILLRSRGGVLNDVVAEDLAILNGDYYKINPSHVLGQEAGKNSDDDDLSKKPRYGYQVIGNFERLPQFEERPLCRDCSITKRVLVPPASAAAPEEVPEHLADALKLSLRASAYLSLLSTEDEASLKRAADLQPDLRNALLAWDTEPSDRKLSVGTAVRQYPELGTLYSVFKNGSLIPQIDKQPTYKPRYSGDMTDIPGISKFLFGQNRELTIGMLRDFFSSLGVMAPSEVQLTSALASADFATSDGKIFPPEFYYSGDLWPRFDAARAAAESGDVQAAAQAARLLKLIGPATYAEIQAEPRMGWLPIQVLTEFINHSLRQNGDSAEYTYTRDGAFLTLEGINYLDLPLHATENQLLLLGFINHDMDYFKPRKGRSEDDTEERRIKMAEHINGLFNQWIEERTDMQAKVAEAFNRRFRGWRTPSFSPDNLAVARWNDKKPLHWYQNSGVRRLATNHGGGLFFDVGLGKTRTILATIALARQEGWARRPVIVVPNPVVYNWLKEISVVLPDFSVGVIGSKTRKLLRGQRKGQLESETDSPTERAAKWQRFKAGLYDCCLLTYSSLARTRMKNETLLDLLRASPAMTREIGFQQRAMEERIAYLSKLKRLDEDQRAELEKLKAKFGGLQLTERRQAIKEEKEEAFVAEFVELPEGQEHDPGIYWEELGIDLLAFDEAHNGKNLWTAGTREGGQPKFLGSPQKSSNLAMQMYFRAATVRKQTGGSGIYLADATPAKNSPLEFLSLGSLLDDRIWGRWGISDAEQFLTQYLKIEMRNVISTDLEAEKAPCVVGFRNLDQFREVLFRYGEFRTAKEVGLKQPEPKSKVIEIALDDEQEAKYQRYLAQYEAAIKKSAFDEGGKFVALALLQRMSLVAVHAELDDPPVEAPVPGRKEQKPRWTFKNASMAASFSSPKIDTIAKMIAQRKDCGHLVFLENNAVHYWLRERLVDFGMKRERIGILNGEVAASNLARQRIAEGFTSEDAIYDVVIANKIAYEGVNLQGRTCTIFHGDLPWEPATITQRNGRGLRQGNINEVIYIYYVLCKASMDMARFQLIQGKREWMSAVIASAATEASNPGAQQEMSPDEWLMWLSRDPEKTKLLLEQQRAKAKDDADQKTIKLAWAAVRSIAVRHRDSRAADPVTKQRLHEDIDAIAADLEKIDSSVWAWKFIVPEVVKKPTISFAPTSLGAIWQGASYRRRNYADKVIDSAQFGRIFYEPRLAIGYRDGGTVKWRELEMDRAAQKWELTSPKDWQESWDALLVEIREPMAAFLRELAYAPWEFREMRFDLAPEDFVVEIWNNFGRNIFEAIKASAYAHQTRLPLLRDGKMVSDEEYIKAAQDVIPFTEAGFQQLLTLAQNSELRWAEVEAISQWWWHRSIPRNLLTQRDQHRKSVTKGVADGKEQETDNSGR